MPVSPFIRKSYHSSGQPILNQGSIPYTGTGSYYSDALKYVQRVGSAIAPNFGSPSPKNGPSTNVDQDPKNPSRVMVKTRQGRSYTRTLTKRRKRRYGKGMSISKRIVAAMPAKHFLLSTASGLSKGATILTWSPTQSVIRGTADNQRIGDTITLCSLKWNGIFNSNTVSNSYSYRMLIGFTGEEFSAATFLTNYTTGELFQSGTVAALKSNGIVNPKAFTVLHDEKFTISSNLAGVVDVLPVAGTLSLKNQKFFYQSDGSVYGKTKNLVVILIGDEVVTSAATDAGGASISFDFCFK